MLLVLSQFTTVPASALRPFNALMSAHGHLQLVAAKSAHGHLQLVAAKSDAAQRAEQPELGREAHNVERSSWCTILR